MKNKENAKLIDDMQDEYDFSTMKEIKNPYPKLFKKQITININSDTIDYFKQEAKLTGIPYQSLINLYLTDCATKKRKLNLTWK